MFTLLLLIKQLEIIKVNKPRLIRKQFQHHLKVITILYDLAKNYFYVL